MWCKLSAVSYDPLTHSRHNAGDGSTKVGHEIKDETTTPFFLARFAINIGRTRILNRRIKGVERWNDLPVLNVQTAHSLTGDHLPLTAKHVVLQIGL